MGYVLLNVIQGSDSVSGPYIRRGAHPPPHRHRPRVPTNLTHNHATGFPRRPCRGSLLGRPLPRFPASRSRLVRHESVTVHVSNPRQSLVNGNVDYFFPPIPYVKGGGPRVEEWCENPVSCEKCVQLALQAGEELERAAGSGIFHT